MSTTIIIIEVALLFFALGVAAHAFWAMGKEEHDKEFDLTPFNNRK